MMNNSFVHLISLGTIIVSMLIFGTFLLLSFNIKTWLEDWGHSLTMAVYLEDDISLTNKDHIAAFLKSVPSAKIKRFISKDDAYRDLKIALGPHSDILEGLPNNPLPASFEVILDIHEANIDGFKKFQKKLESYKGIEEVQFSEDWSRRFEGMMNVVRYIGFTIGGCFCLCVLFIITNTIKLTLYSRSKEIEIMKLVGATDYFIRVPILIEGLIQGCLGGLLAILALYCGYLLLVTKKISFLSLAVLEFQFLPYEYWLSIFVISVILGLIGSMIAVGRFVNL